MAKPFLGLLSGMSGSMLATILGSAVACSYGTFMLNESRTVPSDYDRLDASIRDAQELITEFSKAPVLPPLAESWREVKSGLALAGLTLVPSDGADSGTKYSGQLKAWSGSVNGDAKSVLAAIKKAQQLHPVYLFDYKAEDGSFTLNFAVVGI